VGLGADRDLGAAAADLVQVEELDLNFIRAIRRAKTIGETANRLACFVP
jgi:hypothetical protein